MFKQATANKFTSSVIKLTRAFVRFKGQSNQLNVKWSTANKFQTKSLIWTDDNISAKGREGQVSKGWLDTRADVVIVQDFNPWGCWPVLKKMQSMIRRQHRQYPEIEGRFPGNSTSFPDGQNLPSSSCPLLEVSLSCDEATSSITKALLCWLGWFTQGKHIGKMGFCQ